MLQRIKKLQTILKANNLDCLLLHELEQSKSAQVRYLCGYSGDNGLLLVLPNDAILITDFRYKTQIAKEVKGAKKVIAQQSLFSELGKFKQLTVKNLRIGYLDEYLPSKLLGIIKKQLPESLLVPTTGLVESIAIIKDTEEVTCIERAVEIADVAFDRILQIIRPGISELDVAAELEYQMKMLGSENPSFETIIASGYRSALPHGRASAKKIKTGEFVTLDFGATYDGYHSDITRTVVVGKADAKQKKIYNLVLKAQISGCKKARAGLTGPDVDKHVRDIISKAGYGKQFGHGLGHGIGLLIHEGPRLSPLSSDLLQPNMVVTIEPGIYLEGWGGVRIEDDVVITKTGCRIMNKAEKRLIEL
jgi:Xaa-Pro aminopeptidase